VTVLVGVDLGGTMLRVVALDAGGAQLWSESEAVDHSHSRAPRRFTQLVGLVQRSVEAVGPPAAIGVGSTGPLDLAAGSVINPYTLPPALNGPLVDVLGQAFGVPVALHNDAVSVAVGEAWLGAARGAEVAVAVTLGTGIGVGVARSGRPVVGARGWHAEAGHQVLDPGGPACYCGMRGCWEQLCSGPAIARAMATHAAPPAGSSGWSGAEVSAAARAGDPRARAVLEEAGRWLGLGLVNVLAFQAPDVIVLGGGVARAPYMLDAARRALAEFTLQPPEGTALRRAELGELAGACGAAHAALVAQSSGDGSS
jgi:glucokinase